MRMIVWFVFVLGALSAAGEVFIAKVGQKARLNCGVSSYRRSLVWRHGEHVLFTVDQRGYPLKGTGELVGRSVMKQENLEISSVKETDAGKFTCLTDGTPQEHSLLVFSVSVSVTPSAVLQLGSEATLQCEVKGLVEGCEVKWKSPNASSAEGTSTAQLKPVTSLHDGTWQCIVTYRSKELRESLTIKVQEPFPTTKQPPKRNGSGKGNEQTTCLECTDKGVSLQVWGLPWWVWVAIGAGCLVVILLMVCVIVLCMRVRRRRRKFMKQTQMAQQRQRLKKYCQCDHSTAAAKPKQGRRREKPSALPLHSI